LGTTGFAHGFQAIEESWFLYLVTKEYDQARERCINWSDPVIGVKWPNPTGAILSNRDKACPPLSQAEYNFEYTVSQ
jgi:dTDP-4-dehydrorhamnose 3,5-epimerase (EC 5.1.3.13)